MRWSFVGSIGGAALSAILIWLPSTDVRAQEVKIAAARQVRHFPLDSVAGLRLNNVMAEPAVLQGRKGLRVSTSQERMQQFKGMTPEQVQDAQTHVGQYAVVEGVEFGNGIITLEMAGAPAPGAGGDARGFFGIAFRLQSGAYD